MTDIDHLIKFDSEDLAKADPTIGKYFRPGDDESPGAWSPGRCSTPRVFTVSGTETITDPDTGLTSEQPIKSYLPYWYLWITFDHVDADIMAMANCMIVADREAALRGEDFIRYIAPALIPTMMDYFIEPIAAGADYPFG